MSKIIEYLESLDKKNFIMLILSSIIIFGILFYYLNDYFASKKTKLFTQKIKYIKKIRETEILNKKILKIKKENISIKSKIKNIKSDLLYLLSEIDLSNVLIIKNRKFLKILHYYILSGANVNASFKIYEKKPLEKYNIFIKGKFYPENFFDFTYFLKTLEKPEAIITINNLKLIKESNEILYDINLSIWSFK